MESFPPPSAADIVHQPDNAPFLQPDGGGRSRWWLWTALGVVAVAAIVLGVVLFADSVGDGTHPEASSQSTSAEPVATSGAPGTTGDVAASASAPTSAADASGTTDAPASTSRAEPSTTSESAAPAAPTTTAAPAGTTAPATTVDTAATTAAPPATVTIAPIPGWDLSGMTMENVIVSPGKTDGRPSPGAVLLAPGVTPPTFPASTDYVCIFWNVTGIPSRVPNGIVWTRDGQVVRSLEQTSFDWDKGSRERPNWCVPSRPDGIDPGQHRVEYYVAGVPQWAAEFTIGG